VREIRLAAQRPKPAPRERTVTEMPLACQAVLTADALPAPAVVGAGKVAKRRLAGEDAPRVLDRN
jgi:hypothetical protein